MNNQLYTVTLQSDNGLVSITTLAPDPIKAIQWVCEAEKAPIIAVTKLSIPKSLKRT